MAEHSPTPWRVRGENETYGGWVADADDTPIFGLSSRPLCERIARAVNAITAPGPIDLDAALIHADEVDIRGLHAAAEAMRGLVAEVVRLGDELKTRVKTREEMAADLLSAVADVISSGQGLRDPHALIGAMNRARDRR